jgi:HlyD family secretion protein
MTGQTRSGRSIRQHLLVGFSAMALAAGGVGGWAATTELSGAVIAPSLFVVDTNVKKVQHPTGGIVGELNVRDGDLVRAGDILVRLDETQTRAALAIVSNSLDELAARQARLEAERDSLETIAFPPELAGRAGDPHVGRLIGGERKLFDLRRTARDGQKAQLRERIAQLQEEVRGLVAQGISKVREIELIRKELEGVRELWAKNLVSIQRVTELERTAARLDGERGEIVANQAKAKGRASEIELQIIQIDQDLRSEVAKELREIQAKSAELAERKVAAHDQLKRIDIRAPQGGVVHQLAVHTVGGVVGPGETLMLVVPQSDELRVEVRIAPQDIDQIRLGQPATLRLSAFNQRTTPELNGEVSRISADLTQDQKTGAAFYTVRIGLSEREIARLGALRLVPGMPVEAFIQTGERTVLSYLLKPLTDHVAKAFREE